MDGLGSITAAKYLGTEVLIKGDKQSSHFISTYITSVPPGSHFTVTNLGVAKTMKPQIDAEMSEDECHDT